MSTYTGKLLRVNIATGATAVEPIPDQVVRDFMGPRGFGIKYLYDELKPGIDPLGPENKLFLGASILGGTYGQGFAKWGITTKSPTSGGIAKSICGGDFGARLKIAGFDAIIIEDKAERPSYIHIEDGKAEILDATELWGLDTEETQDRLRQKHGPKTVAACIGPAGEKLAKYAAVICDRRTAARCGVGAVMGSKNLKAVAVNAVGRVIPHEPQTFKRLSRELVENLTANQSRMGLTEFGTVASFKKYCGERHMTPVRNFREGSLEGVEKLFPPEFNKFKLKDYGCYGCMTRCGKVRQVTAGPYAGALTEGPEYEGVFALGAVICNTDPAFAIAGEALCDLYGIDIISTGVCIAFACELFERGIISAKDADGLELIWGNHAAFYNLIEKIGKREGFGELLGEGTKRAAEQIGQGAERYAMNVKGIEIAGYEPRAVKGYALSYAVSTIGSTHMWARPFSDLDTRTDPLADEGKGELILLEATRQAIGDCITECVFGNRGLNHDLRNQLLVAATGIEEFGDQAYLDKAGQRILCLERAFNIREGFSRKDDTLPSRFLTEPLLNAGPATGQIVRNMDGLVDEYYDAAGYARDGIPTPQKLKDLGLEYVISEMPASLP
jgi:aldehyde:ferredoxin oxidoreductase